MDEETWKKGEELIKRKTELKTNCEIRWSEEGTGDNFILLCELLKGNAISTKTLDLFGDEKERRKGKKKKKVKKVDNGNDI